jgi:hypothetical protein
METVVNDTSSVSVDTTTVEDIPAEAVDAFDLDALINTPFDRDWETEEVSFTTVSICFSFI